MWKIYPLVWKFCCLNHISSWFFFLLCFALFGIGRQKLPPCIFFSFFQTKNILFNFCARRSTKKHTLDGLLDWCSFPVSPCYMPSSTKSRFIGSLVLPLPRKCKRQRNRRMHLSKKKARKWILSGTLLKCLYNQTAVLYTYSD